MKKSVFGVAGVLGLCGAINASAAPTPYPTPGVINPVTYSFIATGSGNVDAYFVGESAAYGSMIGMSVNGGPTGPLVLQNHNSNYGDTASLGSVNAGDVITFVLATSISDPNGPPPIDLTWYSNQALNSDGLNHIYSAPYGGDPGGTPIPAGTYVGFEDLEGGGDLDYDDHQFVFTGPFQTTVPDGGSTALLMGLGALGLAAVRSRRK